MTSPRLVNLGCGRHYHPDWINIDLVSNDPQVIERDLRKPLPFEEGSLDGAYHSHVLEHLTPAEARRFIQECYRILKPGGVLRIAVPDLEQITSLYLDSLRQAWNGESQADFHYHWMKLELLDQMTRTCSGGEMGRVMSACPPEQQPFLESRMGGEYRSLAGLVQNTSPSPAPSRRQHGLLKKLGKELTRLRDRLVRSLLKRCYGKAAVQRWDEATFRGQGEIHQWMYDRYSLKCLLEELGFVDVVVQTATTSSIDHFASYELDACGDRPRKPDSLFVEARRPTPAESARRAA